MGKLKAALLKHKKHELKVLKSRYVEEQGKEVLEKRKEYIKSVLKPVHIWSDALSTNIPFRPDATVLLVGEGDMSFTLALSKLLSNNALLIPTVYEQSEEELYRKHPRSQGIVRELQTLSNVRQILYGVDAMHLAQNKQIKSLLNEGLDAIVFNFPHTGSGCKDRSRNILGNQKVLGHFFKSCAEVIAFAGVEFGTNLDFRTTLTSKTSVEGDGEDQLQMQKLKTQPTVMVTLRQGDPYDDWNLKGLAKASGLTCSQSFPFLAERYPGYAHCRTDGGKEEAGEFLGKSAKMHVFTLFSSREEADKNRKDKKKPKGKRGDVSDEEV